MRIVDRKAFLSLPPNTLYCKYSSLGSYGDVCIKTGVSGRNDWYYSELTGWVVGVENSQEYFNTMQLAEKEGKEFRFDLNIEARDGLYEEDEMFAVFDKEDISRMINKLNQLIKP
jgi:hypothetical protein